jgi:hypothetical protein
MVWCAVPDGFISERAAFLEMGISRSMLRLLTREGKIKRTMSEGGRVCYKPADVAALKASYKPDKKWQADRTKKYGKVKGKKARLIVEQLNKGVRDVGDIIQATDATPIEVAEVIAVYRMTPDELLQHKLDIEREEEAKKLRQIRLKGLLKIEAIKAKRGDVTSLLAINENT